MIHHFSILELVEMGYLTPMRPLMNYHEKNYKCRYLYVRWHVYGETMAIFHRKMLEEIGEDYLPYLEGRLPEIEAERDRARAEVERVSPLIQALQEAHPSVIQACLARLRREQKAEK
jgi:hypothetical protein